MTDNIHCGRSEAGSTNESSVINEVNSAKLRGWGNNFSFANAGVTSMSRGLANTVLDL